MPNFGDYETVGEPVVVANETGHSTTVWQARKAGAAQAGNYAIKVYTPHRKATRGLPEEALDRDRGLEFLEGVKQLKKVHTDGGRCLTPVYALGIAPEGAWYATDFYQRGSLANWISARGKPDDAALRQIVRSIVTGCLDLKRLRGISHGNLKTSNVLLVGKTQPLRKTPMVLADPYPAAPVQLSQLEGEDRQTANELLQQVMEVQDLRALGEIILQLVEGRLIASAYDYNYPTPRSAAWNNLGKEGERWRELCNQLLDPQLSPDNLNLESLAKKFPAESAVGGKVMAIAAVLVLVGLVGGGVVYGFKKISEARKEKAGAQFEADMKAAQDSLGRTNLLLAFEKVEEALAKKPEDAGANELKSKIENGNRAEFDKVLKSVNAALQQKNLKYASNRFNWATNNLKMTGALEPQAAQLRTSLRNEQDYVEAMDKGEAAYELKNYGEAITQGDIALTKKPGDTPASNLKSKARTAQANQTVEQRHQSYVTAMISARQKLDALDFNGAIDDLKRALLNQPGDVAALALQAKAEKAKQAAEAQLGLRKQYEAAMAAANEAYEGKDYVKAVEQAKKAVDLMAGDAAALALQAKAEKARQAAEAQLGLQKQYETAMAAANGAYEGKDFAKAIEQAKKAVSLVPGDSAALALQEKSEKAKQAADALLGLRKQYEAVMAAGNGAYDGKDYVKAIGQAKKALGLMAGDAAALALQTKAEKAKQAAEALGEIRRQYDAVMAAGNGAYDGKDYDKAIEQAKKALGLMAGDTAALALQAKAEARKQYDAAMMAGNGAYDGKDYVKAIEQAKKALGLMAGDAAALALQAKAEKGKQEADALARRKVDYSTALNQVKTAEYEKALLICGQYPADAEFKQLSATINARQKAYNGALQDFEILLVEFNVITKKQATTPEAKTADTRTSIGNGREQFLKQVDELKQKFDGNGWMVGDRLQKFDKLQTKIKNWD